MRPIRWPPTRLGVVIAPSQWPLHIVGRSGSVGGGGGRRVPRESRRVGRQELQDPQEEVPCEYFWSRFFVLFPRVEDIQSIFDTCAGMQLSRFCLLSVVGDFIQYIVGVFLMPVAFFTTHFIRVVTVLGGE